MEKEKWTIIHTLFSAEALSRRDIPEILYPAFGVSTQLDFINIKWLEMWMYNPEKNR